jgi:hypothetical protein
MIFENLQELARPQVILFHELLLRAVSLLEENVTHDKLYPRSFFRHIRYREISFVVFERRPFFHKTFSVSSSRFYLLFPGPLLGAFVRDLEHITHGRVEGTMRNA